VIRDYSELINLMTQDSQYSSILEFKKLILPSTSRIGALHSIHLAYVNISV